MSNSLLPAYETKLFCDIYDNCDDFLTDYKESGLYEYDADNRVDDDHMKTLFFLLYAQYANNPIANRDVSQFKYKMWSLVYKYGASWVKRLDVQAKIRNLTEDELMTGAKAIYDHEMAMGDDDITAGDNPTKIDQKSGNYYTRSKMDAYSQLWGILKLDITSEFIGKFKICFKQFVMNENPRIFASGDED